MANTTTEPARRIIRTTLVGVGQVLPNNGANALVPIPASANAVYVGNSCTLTFDGVTATSTSGIAVNNLGATVPVRIPQGAPNLNIFGTGGTATYIQFCQVN